MNMSTLIMVASAIAHISMSANGVEEINAIHGSVTFESVIVVLSFLCVAFVETYLSYHMYLERLEIKKGAKVDRVEVIANYLSLNDSITNAIVFFGAAIAYITNMFWILLISVGVSFIIVIYVSKKIKQA